jgi:F420-dependent oxidoreductase-like protein
MRLGLNVGYWGAGLRGNTDLVEEADRLGYHSVWAAEAYGADVVSVLAWFGARTQNIMLGSGIMQMPARTPAMTAMTAATLDELSGGRFLLGLGLSGPQVVEGWHGVPYGKPLGKTREYVSIVRAALRRAEPLVHEGEHYQIPYRGADATGLGKALKLIIHPERPNLPIYLASIGPKNVQLTAEIADGWLPVFYSPDKSASIFGEYLEAGFALSTEPAKAERFDIAPSVSAVVTDDLEVGRNMVKPFMALYIGGMGARGKNFYFDLARRYGYERAATEIQDLYLSGKKEEAIRRVPDELVDETNLIGPRELIRDRLEAWKESGVTTLLISTMDIATVRTLAELVL